MPKIKRELYYKKIGDLTQKEFEQLFDVATDITDPSFRERIKPILDESIAGINLESYKIEDLDFVTAYLLGSITAKKGQIPENSLIVLFGEPGCGKSYLIHLISELKKKDLTQITEEDREFLGIESKDYTSDREIRELKYMVDDISIIQKKTTRPARSTEKSNPEIQAGATREEVEKCDWTYEFSGNLYGIEKKKIDETLKTQNAMLIVNDSSMEVIKDLERVYTKNFLPLILYKEMGQQEWIKEMMQAGRTEEEIQSRLKLFGISQRIYAQIGLAGVIFNMSKRKNTYKSIKTAKKNNGKRR